jgi:hypothetical protein
VCGKRIMYVHSGGLEGVSSMLARYRREGFVPWKSHCVLFYAAAWQMQLMWTRAWQLLWTINIDSVLCCVIFLQTWNTMFQKPKFPVFESQMDIDCLAMYAFWLKKGGVFQFLFTFSAFVPCILNISLFIFISPKVWIFSRVIRKNRKKIVR